MDEAAAQSAPKPSGARTMIGFALAAILGLGVGAAYQLYGAPKPPRAEAKPPEKTENQKPAVRYHTLPAIIANVAEPPNVWIRLELAIPIDPQTPPVELDKLAQSIAEDTLAFVRTLSLRQVEGATGLLHLREDLAERVRIRSKGVVKQVIIRSMVVQ